MSEMPIETELVEGAWYSTGDPNIFDRPLRARGGHLWDGNTRVTHSRLIAVYRLGNAAQFMLAEPEGLGAVVVDANGDKWVRGFGRQWSNHGDLQLWANIPKPVGLLSKGVTS